MEKLETGLDTTDKLATRNREDIDKLEKLKNMVDFDTFDEEINNLKLLINSLGSGEPNVSAPVGPSISSKDLARLKELTEKIPGLEEMLQKILKDLKGLDIGLIKE